MKKRFIALLFFLLIFSFLLSGCSKTTEIINSEKTQTSVNNYSLFRTTDVQDYLSFLENFDETNFEIVDISTSMSVTAYGSNEFYIVTYKTISE